jgi:1-phosphofructokinase family hexose kinase
VIVTVTPNPALDLTWPVDRLTPGETHRVPAGAARAGGKGLNVARVLHQQGHPVMAVTTSGGLTGTELARDLAASALPHRLVPVAAATRRSAAIVDAATGEATILNEYGVNHSAAEWNELSDAVSASLPRASVLVGSGSLPEGADTEFFARLVTDARRLGLPTVIDTSGPGLLAAARAGAHILKPNGEELAAATGDNDPVRAARVLIAAGAGLVLVSLGAAGMLAVSAAEPSQHRRARLPRALCGNPTGAGDAAVAAAAFSLAVGETAPESILRRATAWSAAAVLMPVAGEISPRHPELAAELTVELIDVREETR